MNEVQRAIRERYPDVPLLIWNRSVEYAKTNGQLFDIMDTLPKKLPIVWSHENYRWVNTDLLKSESLET